MSCLLTVNNCCASTTSDDFIGLPACSMAAVYISKACVTILVLIVLHHAINAKFGSKTGRSFEFGQK